MNELNIGMELESISAKVDEMIASDASVEALRALRTEIFGYKPTGRIRIVRKAIYMQFATAAPRSAEKKAAKVQLAGLRTLEDTLANKLDEAIVEAKSRAKAAKEEAQAVEHSTSGGGTNEPVVE